MNNNLFILFGLTVFYFCPLHAQVKTEMRTMSLGTHESLLLNLPNTDQEVAISVWKKFVKEFSGKNKRNRGMNEFISENVNIPGISDFNPVDMYAKFVQIGPDANITLWIDLGGAFVGSKDFPLKKEEAEKMLLRYSIEVAREMVSNQLEQELKELKKLLSEFKKLEKDNVNYHSDIEFYKEKIKKAEAQIELNVKGQELMKQKIDVQQKRVDKVQARLKEIQ